MGGRGRGWHGDSRLHSLARKGISTNIDGNRRFAVNNFVARGKLNHEKFFPLEKQFNIPKTKKQIVFENIIRDYISELVQSDIKLHVEYIEDNEDRTPTPEEIRKYEKEQYEYWNGYMMRAYHDDDRVAFDGTLYDIINYGQADYGFGKRLGILIHEGLEKEGYYYELETNSILIIVDR